MQYRTTAKIEDELSLLGYGCMRFAKRMGRIDQAKAEQELSLALERGVNYFDTAYIYPGSEEALGTFAAKDGNRERMLIATKMPHYTCKSLADFDRIFAEELKRLQTSYVDYYLIHMLTSLESWERCVRMGVPGWIQKKKEEGAIRHIGFSYHGGRDDFQRIVDAYPWEFCQIQLNYLDAHSQAGLDGLHYAAKRGLPVIIMEPLRGGRLADALPAPAAQVFKQRNAERVAAGEKSLSLAQWGLQWLYNLPEVTCVLSGMNATAQVEENCTLAGDVAEGSLTPQDLQAYEAAIEAIRAVEKVPCTGCGYCMPCPKGIDIPTCFRSYNARYSDGWFAALWGYVQSTALTANPKSASDCVKCGKCAKHCPQGIDVPAQLEAAARTLETLPYKIIRTFKGVYWKS